MSIESKIGFLGLGKMGSAIAAGLLNSNPDLVVHAYDITGRPAASDLPANRVQMVSTAAELESASELLIICVKPQDMATALSELKGTKNYVSIAAGVSLAQINTWMPGTTDAQLARVMPNISALVGQSVSGIYCRNSNLRETTETIFRAIGQAVVVPTEELMHAVTGLSGSGPAFVFAFIQAMAEGGVQSGLSYETALKLAVSTTKGAAEMLEQAREHPNVLRNRVTSPGGTTIAGLKALEEGGFHGLIMKAVESAAKRSREMGQ